MSANEIQVSWETHCFIHYTYIHIYVVIVLVATNWIEFVVKVAIMF